MQSIHRNSDESAVPDGRCLAQVRGTLSVGQGLSLRLRSLSVSAIVLVAGWMVFAIGGASVARASSDEGPKDNLTWGQPSGSAWAVAAKKYDVDPVLLYAIALRETGLPWSDGMVRPWPWCLHAPKEGALCFRGYAGALRKLNSLLLSGETNVDIGAGQINWRANSWRLPDPAQLLQPFNNIMIEAEIFWENVGRNRGNVRVALAQYNSFDPRIGDKYAGSVLSIADQLRRIPGFATSLMK